MRGLVGWCIAHHRRVVFAWIGVAIGITVLASVIGSNYVTVYSLHGTLSQQAYDRLAKEFKVQSGDADTIVFHVSQGTGDSPTVRAAMVPLLTRAAAMPHLAGVVSPYAAPGAAQVSKDRMTAFATVNFDEPANQLPNSTGTPLLSYGDDINRAGGAMPRRPTVVLNGQHVALGAIAPK